MFGYKVGHTRQLYNVSEKRYLEGACHCTTEDTFSGGTFHSSTDAFGAGWRRFTPLTLLLVTCIPLLRLLLRVVHIPHLKLIPSSAVLLIPKATLILSPSL